MYCLHAYNCRSWNAVGVDMNMTEALLEAAQNDHTEIVSCLLQKDLSLGAKVVERLMTSKSNSTELSLLTSIFKVMSFSDNLDETLIVYDSNESDF